MINVMFEKSFSSLSLRRGPLTILLIVIVLVVGFFFYTKLRSKSMYRSDLIVQSKSRYKFDCSKSSFEVDKKCHWYFVNYIPSKWESVWYNNIDHFQNNVCEKLSKSENLNKTILLMKRLIKLQIFGRKESVEKEDRSNELFSQMIYRFECYDPKTKLFVDIGEVSQLIEPLIGLLRDPLTICSPLDQSQVPKELYEGAILLSRRHLLLSVSAPYSLISLIKQDETFSIIDSQLKTSNSSLSPWMYQREKINQLDSIIDKEKKKNLLFDLGSSYYGPEDIHISETSTRWFYEYYKRYQIEFDRIIAYEATPLDPRKAWEQLPEDVFPIYTLINSGCTNDGLFNPWKTLKSLAKFDDYVVVKIDIDTFDLENNLINQLLNDSTIYSLVDELFFEHHVSVKEMLAYWRPPPGNLRDSYLLFTKLRQLGIRMHSWP